MKRAARVTQLAAAIGVVVALGLFLARSPRLGRSPSFQSLDADLTALRARFNQDAGHVRVLLLLSPT